MNPTQSSKAQLAAWTDEQGVVGAGLVIRRRNPNSGILTRDRWIGRRLKWHLEWKREDLWVGAFWRTYNVNDYGGEWPYATEAWVCLLPCLPVNVIRYQHDARPQGWKAGWWASKPWRWNYGAIYDAQRKDGDGRIAAVWHALTFPHVHAEDES